MAFQSSLPISLASFRLFTSSISTSEGCPRRWMWHSRRLRPRASHDAAGIQSDKPSSTPQPGKTDASTSRGFSYRIRRFAVSLGIGLAGSLVGSLIGAGGGIVMNPLLLLLNLSQQVIHGTSLCAITVTAAVSAFRYASASQVNIFAASMLALGAIFTAPLGARSSFYMNAKTLKKRFGLFLVFVSLLIPSLPFIVANAPQSALPVMVQNGILVLIGLLSGYLSGLLGIGGGTINVPSLVLVAGFGQKEAQGSALLAMLAPSVFASFSHAKLKQVQADLLPGLVLGALIGANLGSGLALFLPERILRLFCSLVFFSVGVRYLRDEKR